VGKRRLHLALACWEKLASLILINTYFVGSPSQATVTVQDTDTLSTNPVSVAAISSNPDGIDYQTNSNSLIISRGDTLGTDKNFKRLDSAYPWRFVE